MLKGIRKDVGQHIRRTNQAVLRFAHDQKTYPRMLGCSGCPSLDLCGGLNVGVGAHDCLSWCCQAPETCDRVCRNNSKVYVDRVREIDGFQLENTPRSDFLAYPALPDVVPYVLHGASRISASGSEVVCLRLAEVINFREGCARFTKRADLCAEYKIREDAVIILCGIGQDQRIERWWALSPDVRKEVLVGLRALHIALITSPNFSLMADRPRWDDLHAMKRIALVQSEMQNHGLATALHVNGRTDRDFDRWSDYLRTRPEINCLAYEFLTGPGRAHRRLQHVEWLCSIPDVVGRPLDLVVRGNPEILPELRRHYRRVSFIEANSFMKTMKRQKAEMIGNARLAWKPEYTPERAPLDALYQHNVGAVELWLHTRHGGVGAQ